MEYVSDLVSNLGLGLTVAFAPHNLMWCFFGVFIGTVVGVLPGIGPMAAMSLLFPLTFHLEPTTALVMLAGIYYGTAYGGSTAAILLNVPGTPSGAIACLDGYPMTQQGRAGVALFMTAAASFIGASIGIMIMILFSPAIVSVALKIGSAEYFALMVLGLVAASTVSAGSAAKGLAMVVLGFAFGTVGMDMYTGGQRLTFGHVELLEGISLVAVAMGLFGATEIVHAVSKGANRDAKPQTVRLRSMIPTREDVSRSALPALRGSAIGSFFGALPGTGALISSFMAYVVEKRVAKNPEKFGTGMIEGVVAPEAANNAADQTAFIPTMTLGIPGSAQMALVLGVLIIHGLQPGPTLVTERPDIFWGLIMSFWIGNILLVILNIPMIGIWVRLLQIPFHYLYPGIVVLICLGVYSVSNSAFDVWIVIVFGIVGYGMRLLDFPAAPLILGFVLGPLMEEHFRRAMILGKGDLSVLVTRPISGTFMAISLALLVWTIWSGLRSRKQADVIV